MLLRPNGVVVTDWGKASCRCQVRIEKMNESEPSDDASLKRHLALPLSGWILRDSALDTAAPTIDPKFLFLINALNHFWRKNHDYPHR